MASDYKGFNPQTTGAREVVPVEFWKPKNRRETLVGRIDEIKENRIGSDSALSALIRPAIIVQPSGEGAGYESLRVGLNTVLKARINNAMIGKHVAIMFTGETPTPAGKMKTFKVFELTGEQFREQLDKFAPDLAGEDAVGDDGAPPHDDDDLPF